MSTTGLVAIYFIVWWLVFFVILPWGNRSQADQEAEITPGTMPSAPARPRLLIKAAITSVLAGVVLAGIYAVMTSNLTLDDIPLPNPLEHTVETDG
ncbi:DUF1467 family protein [Amorphus sp. 3PC139-8]|uniref:DUF1467 family protein n=1 Tax=Amorphus sp. 3PC139-8 TaxID=2735676 RepID=UPI00345D8F03